MTSASSNSSLYFLLIFVSSACARQDRSASSVLLLTSSSVQFVQHQIISFHLSFVLFSLPFFYLFFFFDTSNASMCWITTETCSRTSRRNQVASTVSSIWRDLCRSIDLPKTILQLFDWPKTFLVSLLKYTKKQTNKQITSRSFLSN